ncbi:MAG: zf-HC2 domain-containing protein, partial [Gemmatimonadota bacterium]|nr:zf-HC2 domain-containing protein [Gemmatimonadota bacterium]
MRHIPEEELHAYLDQALSRAQCVEIESHLAACPTCRRQRDAIAALRDRTTSLLATLVPARTITPPFELIESRRAAAAVRREHMVRRAVWAASLIAAVGAGWGLSRVADGPEAAGEIAVSSEQANTPTRDEPAFAPVTSAGDTAARRQAAD